jgi:hypothetical protein
MILLVWAAWIREWALVGILGVVWWLLRREEGGE